MVCFILIPKNKGLGLLDICQDIFIIINVATLCFINTQSASLRSLVAAESKAAEIKAAVACFESVCQLLT